MKLNKPLIKEVIRGLVKDDVKLIKGRLTNGTNFCAAGYMVVVAARTMPEDTTVFFAEQNKRNGICWKPENFSTNNAHSLCKNLIDVTSFIKTLYGISTDILGQIICNNDSLSNSEARVKALGERLCQLLREFREFK